MQRYSYTIAIRIWHPSIDPEFITMALGIQPSHMSKAGDKRKTPKGTTLEGTYKESYWHADPFDRGEYSSTDDLIEDSVVEILDVLEPKREFFQKLRSEDALVMLQISSFSGRNYAFQLPPIVLERLAATGLTLAHDVYPYAQNW
ncbi:MAG: DUF4279 domain-containing protein [Candidatus Thiodiazotropha sp. (ex Lucina pensylvanica)]|nr:DUF4279 domain-containing protein [Candidatus Thiodiazotropha sp. (ex Lucina pensylvanica)]